MIWEAILGGIIVRSFGDKIDDATQSARSYLKKWLPDLDASQKENIETLIGRSTLFGQTNFLDLPPSALLLTLEWIEESKDIDVDREDELPDTFIRALDGVLQGNYDLMNAIRAFDIDVLEDLMGGSPIMLKTGELLQANNMGVLSNPLPKSRFNSPVKNALTIFALPSITTLFFFYIFTVIGFTGGGLSGALAVILLIAISLFSTFAVLSFIISIEAKKKDERKWLHRFIFSDHRNFHLNTRGRYILYDLFPDTYTRVEGNYQYGERVLSVLPDTNQLP